MENRTPQVYTIGHSTRSVADFAQMLQAKGIGLLVDVRRIPRSRTNPQYNLDSLPEALRHWQIDHCYIRELGGRRNKARDVPDSINSFWQNRSFHNYADYALSGDFAAGLELLIQNAHRRPTAIMCSEAVWWRCHRRIIADYLVDRNWQVFHLMGANRVEQAKLTPSAQKCGDRLVYPAPFA